MKKNVINVPKGIRYISEWQNFSVFPGSHILDKKIPGCGFTEWCLTNNENVILCSPRLMLIDNKANQHKGELLVVKGSGVELGVDIDMEDKSPEVKIFLSKILQEENNTFLSDLKEGFTDYIRARQGKPLKIITTYDSFHVVKDVLAFHNLLDQFRVYVDEFQSIFTDSRFKADTEMSFLSALQDCNPCYVSATPMMETYLDKIPEFASLPYFEMDWGAEDPTRICRPSLKARTCGSIITEAVRIIKSYQDGDYDKIIQPDGTVVESKEATLFVNSVNNITSIINRAKLSPDQVNILCARTQENEDKIRKRLGKGFSIGYIPVKGEPRKMITICTRTVYLGADFYSDNSRTFIFSDASIETLSVDISLDLPQIMGRQRLDSNPWKNCAEFYYKTIFKKKDDKNRITQKLIDDKLEESNKVIKSVHEVQTEENRDALMRALIQSFRSDKYKSRYTSISYTDQGMEVIINNLVFISEQRAFDIQNTDYSDRFVMFNAIDKALGTDVVKVGYEVGHFWNEYKKLTRKEDKLKLFCQFNLSEEAMAQIERSLDLEVRKYLPLGLDKIKALGFNITYLNNELNNNLFKGSISNKIYEEFREGNKLSRKEIKDKINQIYSLLGLNRKAKASDIEEWFEVKEYNRVIQGKKIHGFELIKKLK